jgi:hypothetical protein
MRGTAHFTDHRARCHEEEQDWDHFGNAHYYQNMNHCIVLHSLPCRTC